jgi:hypothetical protein
MGIDVMIVGSCEAIASRPGEELIDWLDDRIQDFQIRYGYVTLEESDVVRLRQLPADEVRDMLIGKVEAMRRQGLGPPYAIELMISA